VQIERKAASHPNTGDEVYRLPGVGTACEHYKAISSLRPSPYTPGSSLGVIGLALLFLLSENIYVP